MLTAADQLEAIHSMLSAGHRSIRMQRHSLILWGITGGVLCLITEHIITPARFPVHWQRAVALLAFLGIVLSGVAIVDFRHTRHRIQTRRESLPFAQAQVTKAWWLLIGMGVLFTFSTAFFGGGYMVFVIWLVLFGLGIYIHGLFSEQILEWAGIMMILLGVGALALPAPYVAMQWLAASVFGLGMPVLSAMLDRGQSKSVWTRASQSAIWLAVVLVPVLAAYGWWTSREAPAARSMSLQQFLEQGGTPATAIVSIPAGAKIPLHVHIRGDIVEERPDMTVPLTLARPIEVLMKEGKPSGRFRVADGHWKRRESLWIQHIELGGSLEAPNGPAASISLIMTVDR